MASDSRSSGDREMRNLLNVRVRQLSATDTPRWLRALAAEWLMIGTAVSLACALNSALVYALAILFLGTRQHAIAVLGHEGAHGLISRRKWWNDLLANVFCFWPLFLDLSTYRRFHLAHHHHLGTEKDPELLVVPAIAPLPSGRWLILKRAVLDIFGGGLVFASILFTAMRPAKTSCRLGFVGWWCCFLSAAWLSGRFFPVVGLWVVALLTSFLAVFRLRAWTEHRGTEGTHRVIASWWQRWLFLPHNTWCHDEHHRWAAIPFFNLPEARRLDRETPVRTVGDLFASYGDADTVPSGEAPTGTRAPGHSYRVRG